jgi:amino acid adenylation domain-containing protein
VSGKIDRKALPVPGIKTGAGYAAPVNTIEKKLLVIWSEVLGIDKSRIGVEDNFFLLGGHSLRAASMAARIHRELGFKIALTQVFKTSTIRGLTRALGLMNPDKYNTVEPAEEKEYYALSAAQKRLYILQCMDPANTGYNMPDVFYLEGNVDLAKLTKILIKLISRHESLKTSFIMVKGEPVQKIHHEVNFKIEQEQTITHFIRAFDLSTAPLLRVGLQKVEEEKFILLLDMHHIITDGASTAILINDLAGFYEGKELPLLNLHYRDFAEWQNRLLKSGDIKQQEAYWLKLYEDGLPVLELPGDYVRPKVRTFEGDTLYFEILEKEVAALKQMASGSNATLFQVFLTIYYILLAKLGGQEDIVVGTPVLGRTHPDLEQIIGMFVNTLALRNFPAAEKSFHEFLEEVKECVLKGYENQDYQFEDLVEKIVLQRDISRNPFFDVMFIFQEQSGIGIEVPGLKLTPYEYETKTARFDLALTVVESEDKFHMAFEHSTKLFKNETIKRFGEYFKRIAIAVTETPEAPLTAIEIISESEKKQVLFDFNDTAVEYPGDKTIHRLFEEQVERTPDRVAVIDSIDSTVETLRAMSLQNHITYRQLNEQSDRLARFLIEKGILADSIVGIMLGRSIEMIIGIIGILKSGGAYLPIDPEYPQERINYMVKDSAAKILLTSSHHSSHIIHHSSYFAHHSNHLAYIIYTSGSSGKPKGVMIEHRSIINTLHWRKNQYCFDEKDATLQLPSFSFDSSVEDIFTPLISGSRLVLIHARQRFDVNYLKMLLVNLRVTHFLILPNLYRTYIDAIPESLRGMKTITVAGENFSEDLVKHHFERLSRVRLFNEYGPTENSVCSTVYEFTPGQTRILIGKPIANVNCYIVNPYWKLNPVGIPGELCVSGEGISRGYLNNPELTAEKFIDCHHLSFNIHHSKLYCTGDLARWLDDGSPADGAAKGVIEFLGRIDNQVKIRGFRIELGEIETRLLMHNKIKDAVVIADAAICAYIVPTAPETLNMSELREYLSGLLPAYMVPTFFVQLERIPLTPNGKINRRALPAADIRGAELKRTYVAPKTELEKSIAAAWKDILGVTEVGLHDNFFELGGNSLKIIELTARLGQVLNRDIPVVELFKYQTIDTFSVYLSGMKGSPVLETRSHLIERAKTKQELQKERRRK